MKYQTSGRTCKIEGHKPGCGTSPTRRCPGASPKRPPKGAALSTIREYDRAMARQRAAR